MLILSAMVVLTLLGVAQQPTSGAQSPAGLAAGTSRNTDLEDAINDVRNALMHANVCCVTPQLQTITQRLEGLRIHTRRAFFKPAQNFEVVGCEL